MFAANLSKTQIFCIKKKQFFEVYQRTSKDNSTISAASAAISPLNGSCFLSQLLKIILFISSNRLSVTFTMGLWSPLPKLAKQLFANCKCSFAISRWRLTASSEDFRSSVSLQRLRRDFTGDCCKNSSNEAQAYFSLDSDEIVVIRLWRLPAQAKLLQKLSVVEELREGCKAGNKI